jgi:hypothetical protein
MLDMTTISRPCLTFHLKPCGKGSPEGCELNGQPVPYLYDRPRLPLTTCLILFKMYGKYRFHQTRLHEELRVIILWQDISLMSRDADKGL